MNRWKGSLSLLVSWTIVTAQSAGSIEFHGNVYPLTRITLKNHYISLPHRFATVEGSRTGRNINLFFSTAFEYRTGSNSTTLDLREAYVELLTRWGDLRLGKQIAAWGAADGNNPTDNISPYDFYYLFIPGTERKTGTFSLSMNLYAGNIGVDAIMTPFFQPNRLPLNEPDFPIFGDSEELSDLSLEIRPLRDRKNSEFGIRIRLPLQTMDLSLSYFSGFDRMFTPVFNTEEPVMPPPLESLRYYPARVIGGDLIYFLGDVALRTEGAFFLTKDRAGTDPTVRNPYLQYVLQADLSGENSTLLFQYLGTYVTKTDEDSVFSLFAGGRVISERENERDFIPPKMGMPFSAIAQNAVLGSIKYAFHDARHSLSTQALYDFDHKGYMLGGGLTLGVEEAFDLEIGVTYLNGDDESRLYQIRDFSHIYLGMKYSF